MYSMILFIVLLSDQSFLGTGSTPTSAEDKMRQRSSSLTTPVKVSQRTTDRMVSVGVKAIWNFTPTRLTVPPDVLVRNEHIALGLSQIAYHLRH